MFIFPIPQGTYMSRPPGGLCKPDQFNLYTTVAPKEAEPDPQLRSRSLVSRFHTSAPPSPTPRFRPARARAHTCVGPSLPLPQHEAVRCIKDKPFRRLNLLHPSGLHLKQGLVRLKKKCMVKGGRTELEEGQEEKIKINALQFLLLSA